MKSTLCASSCYTGCEIKRNCFHKISVVTVTKYLSFTIFSAMAVVVVAEEVEVAVEALVVDGKKSFLVLAPP